ncbi:TOG array regulator of axonemal microtubules protein 1-like [Huso huso]|uniref:TOG array regulator of axonemal microtubules protein 1-like n=1 Tax=Huso huso TaxID=61971 RepID=A0ABR0ZV45_HUSHU
MHLYGNDWRAVDMELFLPRLKPPVSERCVQSGESQKGVHHLVRGRPHQRRLSLLPIPISSRTQHPLSQPESQKLDKTGAKASSASLDSDTTWSQSMTRGSLEPDGAGTLPLRPAKARSPSQRPLNGFKPIPPIEPGSKKNSPPSEPISKPSPPHPALPENSKPIPPIEPSSTPSSPSEPISNPSSELGSKPTPIIKLCPGPVVMDRGGGKGGSASLSGGPAEKPRVGDSQDKLDESLPSGTLRRRKSLLPIPLLGVARSRTPSPHPPSQPGRSPEVCADRRLSPEGESVPPAVSVRQYRGAGEWSAAVGVLPPASTESAGTSKDKSKESIGVTQPDFTTQPQNTTQSIQTEFKIQPLIKNQTDVTTIPQIKTQSEVTTQTDYEIQPQITIQPEVTSQTQNTTQSEVTTQTDYEIQPQITIQPEVTLQPQNTTQTDYKIQPQITIQPEVNSQPQVATQTEFVTQPQIPIQHQDTAQPQVKSLSEAATQTEFSTQPQLTTIPVITIQSQATAQPQMNPQSEAATQPEIRTQSEATTQPKIPTQADIETLPEPLSLIPEGHATLEQQDSLEEEIHISISKSAQAKVRQKWRKELELLWREKERERAQWRSEAASDNDLRTDSSIDLDTVDSSEPQPAAGVESPTSTESPTDSGQPAEQTLSSEQTQLSQGQQDEEKDEEESHKIHISISKSAQEKVRQKWRKLELLRREKERERAQWRSEDDCVEHLSSDPINDPMHNAVTMDSSKPPYELEYAPPQRRSSVGTVLRRRASRPSLPTVHQLRRHSSVVLPLTSLPQEQEEDSYNEETRPFSRPEQQLSAALKALDDNDWEVKKRGLSTLRCLASWHPDTLLPRLHDVCLMVTREVNNLRSKVARSAMQTLADVARAVGRSLDPELEEVTRVLLLRAGDTSEFLRERAEWAVGVLVASATPSRMLAALIAAGATQRNVLVRRCAAEHMLMAVETLGAERLLGGRDGTELIVQTMVKLAQDAHQDTRFYGRRMVTILMSHPESDHFIQKSLSTHDLHFILTSIKQKGKRDSVPELTPVKGRRSSRASFSTVAKEVMLLNRRESAPQRRVSVHPLEPAPAPGVLDETPPHGGLLRKAVVRSLENMEKLKELHRLLTSRDFQERMQGVSLLLQLGTDNTQLITANSVKLLDWFLPRLQDSNRKVNLQALQTASELVPLLKDSLHPILYPLATVVIDNLNSKHPGISPAARNLLDSLITHTDNVLLLQLLASRVQFISGRATHDVIERLSVLVASVYPRKPQAVKCHVLPVLWHLLGNMTGSGVLPGGNGNVRPAVAQLVCSIHQHMGPGLQESGSTQLAQVRRTLQELIQTGEGEGGERGVEEVGEPGEEQRGEDGQRGERGDDGGGQIGQQHENL